MSTVDERFISFAQNGEDVVLWRALGHVVGGRYLDVGANDPVKLSVTKAFYDRGWSGLCVEPDPEFAARLVRERPGDEVAQVAATSGPPSSAVLHAIGDTGLSTLVGRIAEGHASQGFHAIELSVETTSLDDLIDRSRLADENIHFAVIDTEGSESDVLASLDLERHRPWVLVVEATEPLTTTPTHAEWEPRLLAADYRFCLFDGLSRFYIDNRRHPELAEALSYPACVFDDYVRHDDRVALETLRASRDRLARELGERDAYIRKLQRTLSWRITAPLRRLRRASGRAPSGEAH